MNNKSLNWWSLLKERKTPHPHIPESEILKAMPKQYHNAWKNFIRGQTGLSIPEGFGVYPWDFGTFVGKIRKIEELKESLAKKNAEETNDHNDQEQP